MTQENLYSGDVWARGSLPVYGFLGALFITSFTQELAVSAYFLAYSRTVILFGLLPVFHGLGMFASPRLMTLSPPRLAKAALGVGVGVLSIFSLVLALRLNFKAPGFAPLLAAALLCAAATVFLHGAIFGSILAELAEKDRARIGKHLAGSLLGIAAAALFRGSLIEAFGVNSLILCSGLAAAALSILRAEGAAKIVATLAALFLIFGLFPVDRGLETLRNIEGHLTDVRWCPSELRGIDLNRLEPILDTWSPLSKVNLYRAPGTNILLGAYNYNIVWVFRPEPDPARKRIFEALSLKGRLLAIAMGSGYPLLSLPKSMTHEVIAVEMDPVVSRFFREHPELNRGVFLKTKLVTTEGRNILDREKGPYDAILLDLPGATAALIENAVFFEDYLFTTEAVARYRELLGPDGVLAAYLLWKQIRTAAPAFVGSGLHYRVFDFPERRIPGHDYVPFHLLLASKDPARLDHAASALLRNPSDPEFRLRETTSMPGAFVGPALRDDKPFAPAFGPGSHQQPALHWLLKHAWSFAWISCAVLLAGLLRSGSRADGLRIVYFFLIGVGFILLQSAACARFRSFFSDPLSTVVNVTMLLLGFAALGSSQSDRWRGTTRAGVAAVAATLACAFAASHWIPFASPSGALRFAAAATIVGPPAFISGFFFPIGIAHTPKALLGRCFLADALGACTGFLIFYELYWNAGLSWNAAPLSLCYLAAAAIGGTWLRRA